MTVNHPVFARYYAWLSRRMEVELGQHRRAILTGLTGKVLEIGAGNGMNFRHYPARVTQVLAVEPEPRLRAMAVAAAAQAATRIEVVDGVADNIPAEDGSYDTVVATLVLCTVPCQRSALDEIYRVLTPGGQLRFLEHVAGTWALGSLQRLLDATVWPYLGGGCHTHRDTATAIREAGFMIDDHAVRTTVETLWLFAYSAAPDAAGGTKTQNSFPSGSASTTQRKPCSVSSPESCRAPSRSSRSTSAGRSSTLRSRCIRFLPCFGSGTRCSSRVGAGLDVVRLR